MSEAPTTKVGTPQWRVPLSDIFVDHEALDRVSGVLRSGRFILGEETRAFEKEFAQKFGTKYAVAVSSGTAALFLSMIANHFGPGDEILVPSYSFIATASPIVDVGAKPVFCDVDPETLTIDPNDIEQKITSKTRGIVPVHLFGHPAAMSEIAEIANEHSLTLIEDCAQAHGAHIGDRHVGSFGSAACYSFYPSKNMTVYGDGGMVTTNDSEVAEKVGKLRNHGRVGKYLHEQLGYNFRLSEISSALGRYQLEKLDSFNEARRKVADYYDKELDGFVSTPVERSGFSHVYHMYVVRSSERNALKDHLTRLGIETGIHYPIPIHLQPPFKGKGGDRLPVTEEQCDLVLSLPIYPTISAHDQQYVIEGIKGHTGTNGQEASLRSATQSIQ